MAAFAASTPVLPANAEIEATRFPWEIQLNAIREQYTQIHTQLETIQQALLVEVEKQNLPRTWVKRLSLVAPNKPGYGVLPEISNNFARATVTLKRTLYSLESLQSRTIHNIRAARGLLKRTLTDEDSAFESLVVEFERLRQELQALDSRLNYHRYWQRAIPEYAAYFAKRNRLMASVRQLHALSTLNTQPKKIEALREKVIEQLNPFTPTPGLVVEHRADGKRVLPVTLLTDIDDSPFLNTFRASVEEAFVHSRAAHSMRFAVELTIQRVSPATIYQVDFPSLGSAIDISSHLSRFPRDALVLTTGAASTHAWTGRAIVLGPTPLTPRTLAHEFGHLLGFNDIYLRGYEKGSQKRFGLVIIEWHGLVNNLMGNSDHGRVTDDMIRVLIDAYEQNSDP